jgi:ribosome-associated protein
MAAGPKDRIMTRRGKPKGSQPVVNSGDEPEENPEDRPPSKTTLKAQVHDLRELGLELSGLPRDRLGAAPMPDELREALERFRRISARGAKRRELQYIAKILRGIDPEPLREVVNTFALGRAADAGNLHRVERWRDELIADDQAVTRWMNEFSGSDVQHLRSLVRAARRDTATIEPDERQPASYRELFRFIREQLSASD